MTAEEQTKKCPFCAETIKAEAVVCRYCGRDLSRTHTEEIRKTGEVKINKLKSPSTATLLNAFPLIFGLGYLYIGNFPRFLVVFCIQLFSTIPMELYGFSEYNRYLLLIVWIISMFDVNALTKKKNEELQSKM